MRRRWAWVATATAALAVTVSAASAGGPPTLVADISPGTGHSFPRELVRFGDKLYFRATDGTSGAELWVTDGTGPGTSMVRDINPQTGSSPTNFTVFGERLYFAAMGSIADGHELWKSDGTAAGTTRVKEINPSGSSGPAELAVSSGVLFFTAFEGGSYFMLWKTDGTEVGTTKVANVAAGGLTNLNGTLYFSGHDPSVVIEPELWRSDGTDVGTHIVKDLGPGGAEPAYLTVVGDTLYFSAYTETHGRELWKSDGTADGTSLVKDISPGSGHSNPLYLERVGNALYFWATDADGDTELWKSAGTAAGTVRVKDINPSGSSVPSDHYPQELVAVGNRLFFHARGGSTTGVEVWTSDGTEPGTHIVRDIRPGSASSSPAGLTSVSGELYFIADDGVTGHELWVANPDGTGAERVTDLDSSGSSFDPEFPPDLGQLGSLLVFPGNDGLQGFELWSLLLPQSAGQTLAVQKGGNGGGTVTGSGISCGSDCSETYASGTMVVLTASPLYACTFTGWTDCDSPSGSTCTMTMNASKTVTANFTTTPTFADVPPSNPFYHYIEQLYDLGITTGCGTNGSGQPIFCPGDFVPRQQMAAFLMRATGQTQLVSATPTFADVPTSNPFYGWIERLYEQGVTTGCSAGPPRLYCPAEFVPRQQMAAFLMRAKGQTQLMSPTPTFADVPTSNPFYGWIERLFEQGVTTGCSPGPPRLYCPADFVPRQQMAAFLIRAFAP